MNHTSILRSPVITPAGREAWFALGGIIGITTLVLLLLKGAMGGDSGMPATAPLPAATAPAEEESREAQHYAVVCSGFTKTPQHAKWFGNSSSWIYRVLNQQYGYHDESIYFLFDDPNRPLPKGPVVVDGQMNLENFRKVIEHLAEQVRPGDTVSIFLIGHGIYRKGDSWFDCIGKDLSSTEFAALIDKIETDEIRIVLSPCQMEGFIWKASRKGRVILSSTRFTENNAAAVAEAAIRGFSNMKFDANRDGKLSFAEAYQSMVLEQTQWYQKRGWQQREHALLDDNGDGRGHYLPTEKKSGDGVLAGNRFLGNKGSKIELSEDRIRQLSRENEKLRLTRSLNPYSDGRSPRKSH